MRYLKIVLTTALLTGALLTAGVARSDEPLHLRYQEGFGLMTLTFSQEIEVRQPIASRAMTFDVELAGDLSAAGASLVVESAKASYTAHGMEQRLSTRHLTGRQIPLGALDDGLELAETDPENTPVIDLGPPTSGGFSVVDMLLGVLPRLPVEAVSEGTSWQTEREIRSIEGWAWGSGRVTSQHRVLSIEQEHGKTLINVATESQGVLESAEGERSYTGQLKRSLRWTFDATAGRVVSISMEQETDGQTNLPQGDLPVHQKTRVELTPAA
jgi:hypothetical protein